MASSSSRMVSYSVQRSKAPWFNQAQKLGAPSSNHGFIKLKDGKLFDSKDIVPSMASSSSKTGNSTLAPTMASSSSRMVSYSVQRAFVPNMVSSSSKTRSSTSAQPWLHQAQGW
jgi:hypothetical protein